MYLVYCSTVPIWQHWCVDYNVLSLAVQLTPTTLRLSYTARAVEGPTSTRRPVELMSLQSSPLPAVESPLMAWWASPWTWAAATSSPAAAPTWSTEEAWREAETTYHTRLAPPQPWWATLIPLSRWCSESKSPTKDWLYILLQKCLFSAALWSNNIQVRLNKLEFTVSWVHINEHTFQKVNVSILNIIILKLVFWNIQIF